MKKRKKHKPKTKRQTIAVLSDDAVDVALRAKLIGSSSTSALPTAVKLAPPPPALKKPPPVTDMIVVRAVPTHTEPRSPQRSARKDIALAASAYNADDRQALALLMLPFLVFALAFGWTQSIRNRPAIERDVAIIENAAPAAVPATVAPSPEAPSVQETAKTEAVAPAQTSSDIVKSGSVDPASIPAAPPASAMASAEPAPGQSSAPEATTAAPVAPPASAATEPSPAITNASPEQPVAAVIAAPVIAETRPEAVLSPSKPVELAALPEIELQPPGNLALPPVDKTPAENSCRVEPQRKSEPDPVRIAALGGTAGGGYVDPVAFGMQLAGAAREQLDDFTVYTDKYQTLKYPNGDLPQFYGVCTDVIVRAYRVLGIDLQALVHQSKVGSGDTNIDHRRVGTLQKFFAKFGESIPISEFAEDYWPGDVVSYYRPQNAHSRTHIAIVSDVVGPSGNFMIVHNRGWGPQMEDGLFVDQMTGHYRYSGTRRPDTSMANPPKKPGVPANAKVPPAKAPQSKPAGKPAARASLTPPVVR